MNDQEQWEAYVEAKKAMSGNVYTGANTPYKEPFVAGRKDDSSKPRMDLIDSDAMLGLANVLTFGAKKYAAHNWRNGINFSRVISALERHLAEIKKAVDIDSESNLQHIDHLMCSAMFLSNYIKHPELYTEFDDRWKTRKIPGSGSVITIPVINADTVTINGKQQKLSPNLLYIPNFNTDQWEVASPADIVSFIMNGGKVNDIINTYRTPQKIVLS